MTRATEKKQKSADRNDRRSISCDRQWKCHCCGSQLPIAQFTLMTVISTHIRDVLAQSFRALEVTCQNSLKDPNFASVARLCFTIFVRRPSIFSETATGLYKPINDAVHMFTGSYGSALVASGNRVRLLRAVDRS